MSNLGCLIQISHSVPQSASLAVCLFSVNDNPNLPVAQDKHFRCFDVFFLLHSTYTESADISWLRLENIVTPSPCSTFSLNIRSKSSFFLSLPLHIHWISRHFLASSWKQWLPHLVPLSLLTLDPSHHFFFLEHCSSLLNGLISTLTSLVYLPPFRRWYSCKPKSEDTCCKPPKSFLFNSE